MPINTVSPPATLSLEGVFSTALPTDEATEQPEDESRLTNSTPAATSIMVTVPYAFLEKLVMDQHQIRCYITKEIERIPRVVQAEFQVAEDKLHGEIRKKFGVMQFFCGVDGLETYPTDQIDSLGGLEADSERPS